MKNAFQTATSILLIGVLIWQAFTGFENIGMMVFEAAMLILSIIGIIQRN